MFVQLYSVFLLHFMNLHNQQIYPSFQVFKYPPYYLVLHLFKHWQQHYFTIHLVKNRLCIKNITPMSCTENTIKSRSKLTLSKKTSFKQEFTTKHQKSLSQSNWPKHPESTTYVRTNRKCIDKRLNCVICSYTTLYVSSLWIVEWDATFLFSSKIPL